MNTNNSQVAAKVFLAQEKLGQKCNNLLGLETKVGGIKSISNVLAIP
ncbi:hypothetical protein [Methylomonas sp. AM2-LC]